MNGIKKISWKEGQIIELAATFTGMALHSMHFSLYDICPRFVMCGEVSRL